MSVEAERARAADVLPGLVGRLITGLQIPRGMRWGARPGGRDDYLRFSRPIRWLVCKLGGDDRRGSASTASPFGDVTQGHRVLGAPVIIDKADHYERHLAEQKVDRLAARAPAADRRGSRRARRRAGRRVVGPRRRARRGRLPGRVAQRRRAAPSPSSHLRLPDDGADHGHAEPPALLPGARRRRPPAAGVPLREQRRPGGGRAGHARQRARARAAASTTPSSPTTATSPRASTAMADRLGAVVFHEKLGSLADKARAAAGPGRRAGAGPGAARSRRQRLRGCRSPRPLRTAARLAKADLVSQVVIEFPVLQGVMGGIYAARRRPRRRRGHGRRRALPAAARRRRRCPSTLAGALLAVADKIDNIAGAWVAGEKPSGSRDPYGLRRAAMGIVRIALEYGLRFPLAGLLAAAVDQFELQGVEGLDDERRGASSPRRPPSCASACRCCCSTRACRSRASRRRWPRRPATCRRWRRGRARSPRSPAATSSRTPSRPTTAARRWPPRTPAAGPRAVDPALFTDDAERELAAACEAARGPLLDALAHLELESAVEAAAGLRPAVDRYFDAVLVMDDDEAVRAQPAGAARRRHRPHRPYRRVQPPALAQDAEPTLRTPRRGGSDPGRHRWRQVRLPLQRGQQGHEGAARRQGRQPRRDDHHRPAGAAGFTITTEVCNYYSANGDYPEGVEDAVEAALAALEARHRQEVRRRLRPAAAHRALRRPRLHAGHDGHDPQPRPQRQDRPGRHRAPPATRASPTTATAASSACTATWCSAASRRARTSATPSRSSSRR